MDGWKSFGHGMIAAVALALSLAAHTGRAQTDPPALVVADLDYTDTSGEAADQRADHARRLAAFSEALRHDLQTSGKLRVVPLDCRPAACSVSTTEPAKLVAAAEKAGADYLLFGGVHKESTLLQWAKVEILDLRTRDIVFNRLLSFRGDDDDAWRHAETFIARDILANGGLR